MTKFVVYVFLDVVLDVYAATVCLGVDLWGWHAIFESLIYFLKHSVENLSTLKRFYAKTK